MAEEADSRRLAWISRFSQKAVMRLFHPIHHIERREDRSSITEVWRKEKEAVRQKRDVCDQRQD